MPRSRDRSSSPPPGGQSYVERPPVPALSGLVSSVWIQRVSPEAEPYTQRNIPNGAVELHCPLGALPRVVGPLTGPLVEVLAPGTTVVGLRFHPGAAPSMLGLPASELVDSTVDVDRLWRRSAGELAAGAGTASAEEALAALQAGVVSRLAGAAAPDRLIVDAVRRLRWYRDDVGALTSSLFLSERQLRRRCQDAVGLAPKTLHRVLRFQAFLALVQYAIATGQAPAGDGLARLAAEAGYADQSHLSRECLRLTGLAPSTFLGAAESACACGHDHAASFAPVLQTRAGAGTTAGLFKRGARRRP